MVRFRTNQPVRITSIFLEKPYTYGTGESASKPAYTVSINIEKTAENQPVINQLIEAQKQAKQEAVEDKVFPPKKNLDVRNILLDADEEYVKSTVDGKEEWVLLSEKRPQLENHYSMRLKKRADWGLPGIRYVDEDGIIKPITPPSEDEDRTLWNSLVYAGQYAIVSGDLFAYNAADNYGVSARLENILIVGGGEHEIYVPSCQPADEAFGDLNGVELAQWRDAHKPHAVQDATPVVASPLDKVLSSKAASKPRRRPKPQPEPADDEFAAPTF